MILSAFTDYSLNLDNWELTAGLRYKYQKVKYYEAGIFQKEQSPNYNHFIPNIAISYNSGDFSTTLGYKLLKMSPGYSMLSSAVNYISKYHYQNGNPLLVPQEHHFKDPKRPFIVSAGNMRTRVLGTVFDMNAYSGREISVTLLQGKVQVSNIKTASCSNIVPGQKAVVNEDGVTITRTSLTTAGNWLSGTFEFDDVPLGEAARIIGSWYNTGVVCHSRQLQSLRIHFMFPKSEPIQTVIKALNDLGVARFVCKNNRIDVYPLD